MAYLHGEKERKESKESKDSTEKISCADSSFLSSATYDSVNFSLTFEFKSGDEETYRFIYPVTFQQLKESSSKGSFYTRQIKGKFPKITVQSSLKVSDLEKAIKKYRPKGVKK